MAKKDTPIKAKVDGQIEEYNSAESNEAIEFIDTLKEANPKLFQNLPKGKKEEFERTISFAVMAKSHSGPLPAPETLEHYSKIIPNGAERIMLMAEKEQAFRHTSTHIISKRALNQQRNGQFFAFILALFSVGGGIYLAATGKSTAGIGIIITAMATLAGVFIYKNVVEGRNK